MFAEDFAGGAVGDREGSDTVKAARTFAFPGDLWCLTRRGGPAVPELIWEGKYSADGKKAAPLRVSLPFQTVETVNESAQERQKALDLFAEARDEEWRNRLIWGDKKYVLPSLLTEFAGAVNLVYIDPPFFTGDDFSFS